MTDSADLGDIVVVGQRRGSTLEPWPERLAPVPGIPGELEEADGGGGLGRDPCARPTTRREWNADAAAAEALRKFREKANELGDDDLYEREFGAQLYERADGSVYVGPVTYGNKLGGAVEIDQSQATPGNLVDEIHTHPSPQMHPSAPDYGRLNIFAD